jgi:FkbM family methyltransferase
MNYLKLCENHKLENKMTQNNNFIAELFEVLPTIQEQHAPSTQLHHFISTLAVNFFSDAFKSEDSINFSPFCELYFPFQQMGNITSINLFELDELIIFSFYWQNKTRYNKVLDLGANLGLHSIILAKCGYQVQSFEPVPNHFACLERNIKANNCQQVILNQAAVSTHTNGTEFFVVKGNTTGSHIVGSKKNPYGELEKLEVNTVEFNQIAKGIDLIKMDVEGHESELILNSSPDLWKNTDMMLSIHDETNAKLIFDYFIKHGISMYSQKNNWQKVENIDEMIVTHHDGSLFISSKNLPFSSSKLRR